MKKTSMKALDISSATTQVDPNILKALAILSDTTVGKSTIDFEDLKPHWKSEKRPHFSRWSKSLLFTSFSKTLLNTERRLTVRYNLVIDLSSTLINTETTEETFPHSRQQSSFRHTLKSSASMYKSSGSQFLKTTTGRIKSGPDAFDKSSLFISFKTIWELQKYNAVSDWFYKGKQLKRYLSHQHYGPLKRF